MDDNVKIKGKTYREVYIGNLSLLVAVENWIRFQEIEHLCYEAMMVIPYGDLNFDSKNEWYIEQREELIASLQFSLLSEIIEDRFGDIWIQIPKSKLFTIICNN